MRVYLGQTPARAGRKGNQCQVVLPDGTAIAAERILVAGGREPRTSGLGLDEVGARIDRETKAVAVNGWCQVRGRDGAVIDGLFALGDVTGISSHTHSANYQARIVAAVVSGTGHDADYSAVPGPSIPTRPYSAWASPLTKPPGKVLTLRGRKSPYVTSNEPHSWIQADLPAKR